jgi:hypothetical protein
VFNLFEKPIKEEIITAPLYKNIREVYGDAVADGSNQVSFKPCTPFYIAWNTNHEVGSFLCHEKVSYSLNNIIIDLKYHYGEDELKKLGIPIFGGCYNYQKVRGGNRFCTHSWGVALSLNPRANFYEFDKSKALFAKPEYKYLMDSFYKYGWFNEGIELGKNYGHFQAVRYK